MGEITKGTTRCFSYCTNRCYICFFTRNASTSKFHMEYCLYCFSYRGVIYGIGSIRSKEILSDLSNVSPFLINGIQMFYGGVLLLIASIIVEQPNVTVLASWSVQWPILYLIFMGSIGGHGSMLLALIKNKSSISIDVVICITINCNNCGIYHFRRAL